MPIGQPQPLINVQPSQFVYPMSGVKGAADAMGEAYRRGVISAQDIVKRADERDALKKQFEIKQIMQQLDPRRESLLSGFEDFKASAQAYADETKEIKVVDESGGTWMQKIAPGTEGVVSDEDFNKIKAVSKRIETITPEEWVRLGKPNSLPTYLRAKGNPLSFDAMEPGTAVTVPSVSPVTPAVVSAAAGPAAQVVAVPSGVPGVPAQPVMLPTPAPAAPAAPSEITVFPRTPGATLGAVVPGKGRLISVAKPETGPQRAATEAQTKASIAVFRFDEAEPAIRALKEKGYDPATWWNSFTGLLPEFIKPEDRKLFENAKSAWSQGLLRLESGAAISVKEQAWYEKTFFPVAGDSEAVQQQKAALRGAVRNVVEQVARQGHIMPGTPEAAQLQNIHSQAEALSPEVTFRMSGTSPSDQRAVINGVLYIRQVDPATGRTRLLRKK